MSARWSQWVPKNWEYVQNAIFSRNVALSWCALVVPCRKTSPNAQCKLKQSPANHKMMPSPFWIIQPVLPKTTAPCSMFRYTWKPLHSSQVDRTLPSLEQDLMVLCKEFVELLRPKSPRNKTALFNEFTNYMYQVKYLFSKVHLPLFQLTHGVSFAQFLQTLNVQLLKSKNSWKKSIIGPETPKMNIVKPSFGTFGLSSMLHCSEWSRDELLEDLTLEIVEKAYQKHDLFVKIRFYQGFRGIFNPVFLNAPFC